jgi:dipeptidyl aminopeptidase/acylaminoacyl peptidase
VNRGALRLAGLLLLTLAACSSDPAPDASPPSASAPGASSTTSDAGDPTGTPEPSPSVEPGTTLEPEPPPPVDSAFSLPALMREKFRGGTLRQVRVVAETDAYTRSEVTYRSGDVTVSGVLLRPRGRGPFPGIVLNHGYIEPAFYVTGQGLAREQDYLARAGFAVLHTDYRGHAASDPAGDVDRETRLGYTRDVVDAVRALRREPAVDASRLALLGRSMGGGVTLNALVARPGLVDAAVVFAPVSSSYLDNLRRWTIPERPEAARALFARFGSPRQEPGFYRQLSARTYFDRITEPVLIHHGTSDDSCPIAWSRLTQRLLVRAGVDSRLEVYDGEEHAFGPQFERSVQLTIAFLRRCLG